MPADQASAERLHAYLLELKADARELLLVELERAALRGDDVPGAALVLEELRSMLPAMPPERVGSPERLFYAPIEPFLIDSNPDLKHRGRVVRQSLSPIWQWICRDLAPDETKSYSQQIVPPLLANDRESAKEIARAFQDHIAAKIEECLRLSNDDKAQRRLAAQIGTAQAVDELGEIAGILKLRDTLSAFASRLPPRFGNFADEGLQYVKALLEAPGMRPAAVSVYGLLLVMNRLDAPWQLIRLAVEAVESDEVHRISKSSLAFAVTAVIGEMGSMVWRLRGALKAHEAGKVAILLKDIHDASRGLRTEIDLSVDCDWARQLAALRGEVSELLEAEIESIPGRVRRLLRTRPDREIAPGSVLDPTDVSETEAAIDLARTCRSFAGELAVNAVTLRVHSELEVLVDGGTAALLDALRDAGSSDRNFRRSQVEAAVRFAAKIFGADYATLLVKAVDLALAEQKRASA